MHISRAERDDSGKESDLRKYVQEHHLKDKKKLSSEWREIMYALKACHYAHYWPTPVSENTQTMESIYWGVLEYCPNTYWQYPLYVFLHKHMEQRGDDFRLPEEKCEEYELLLQNTARYFFLKSVVYNSVNAVKDTAFRVCAAIAHERDYAAQYRENAEKKDLSEFKRKIADSDLGRNRKGLVLLAAALNPNQDLVAYGDFLQSEKVDIEHILPQKWSNYDGWNDKSHERDANKIGNLMPLKKAINIQAATSFSNASRKNIRIPWCRTLWIWRIKIRPFGIRQMSKHGTKNLLNGCENFLARITGKPRRFVNPAVRLLGVVVVAIASCVFFLGVCRVVFCRAKDAYPAAPKSVPSRALC